MGPKQEECRVCYYFEEGSNDRGECKIKRVPLERRIKDWCGRFTPVAKALIYPALPVEGMDLAKEVRNYEESLIEQALKRANYIKAEAARILKLNRTTLTEKINRIRIAKLKDR